jgi:peptidoglycan hydrolase CwlO-like protein
MKSDNVTFTPPPAIAADVKKHNDIIAKINSSDVYTPPPAVAAEIKSRKEIVAKLKKQLDAAPNVTSADAMSKEYRDELKKRKDAIAKAKKDIAGIYADPAAMLNASSAYKAKVTAAQATAKKHQKIIAKIEWARKGNASAPAPAPAPAPASGSAPAPASTPA